MWHEVIALYWFPCLGVRLPSAAGDDEMDMGMELHVTFPGLQHGDDTWLPTDEFGVLSKLLNGICATSHQKAVEQFLILTSECSKYIG